MNNILDLPIIFTLYGIFVIGSIISMVRGYNGGED
jgi:hypothetical protein